MPVEPGEIIALLGPRDGVQLYWDILLYLIFFLALVMLGFMPDKNMLPTILTACVLLLAVIAKLDVLEPKEFGTLVVNCGLFVIPFIVAGMVRNSRSAKAGRVMAPAVIAGSLGGVYFMMFWFLAQQN